MNQPENPTRHGLSGCLTTADLAATHAIEAAPTPSPDHRTTLRGHPTRTKKTAKPSPPPTTAKTTRRRHQVLAAQVSDIIDTHWKQGAGYHTLHKIATQPLSWCPPLSTTNPDKSPTLGHPANHDMHQRTGQRRKAQAHKSHPGYGTQHAAPWGAHLRAPTRYVTSSHLHTPGVPHQAEANKEQPTTAPDPSERTPGKAQRRQTANAMENHHQQPPRPTGIRSNPPPAPGKPPTHRGRTPTRPRGQGNPQQATRHPNPQGRTPT